jgi:hypothetical protein
METLTTRTTINKEVTITAWYFRNKNRMQSFPRRMEYDNQEYTFAEGLRFLIQKGQRAVQFFEMTDGATNYRLKFDSGEHLWTLVSMSHAERATY